MPTTRVAAPAPRGMAGNVSTEAAGTLVKRVSTQGKCAPSAVSATKARLQVTAANDPWFPLNPPNATAKAKAEQAAKACAGCRVIDDCLILALREEVDHGVYGIRGGKSADERRVMVRKIRDAAKDGAA